MSSSFPFVHAILTRASNETHLDTYRMKVILFTLIRSFEFKLAVSVEDIEKRSNLGLKPYVKGEYEKGPQMPLLVKAVN